MNLYTKKKTTGSVDGENVVIRFYRDNWTQIHVYWDSVLLL